MDHCQRIAADLDAQWDMYLANTYSLGRLQKFDFSAERIPVEWCDDWFKQLDSVYQITPADPLSRWSSSGVG